MLLLLKQTKRERPSEVKEGERKRSRKEAVLPTRNYIPQLSDSKKRACGVPRWKIDLTVPSNGCTSHIPYLPVGRGTVRERGRFARDTPLEAVSFSHLPEPYKSGKSDYVRNVVKTKINKNEIEEKKTPHRQTLQLFDNGALEKHPPHVTDCLQIGQVRRKGSGEP